MQFKLHVRGGVAYVGSKMENASEEGLKAKFGKDYGDVRRAFEDALETWKGSEEELEKEGFPMYESFRPSVPKGQQGWGRKGTLDLENVKKAVAKG